MCTGVEKTEKGGQYREGGCHQAGGGVLSLKGLRAVAQRDALTAQVHVWNQCADAPRVRSRERRLTRRTRRRSGGTGGASSGRGAGSCGFPWEGGWT